MKGHEENREMEGVWLRAWKCLILEAGTKKPSGVRGPFAKDLNEGRDWPHRCQWQCIPGGRNSTCIFKNDEGGRWQEHDEPKRI